MPNSRKPLTDNIDIVRQLVATWQIASARSPRKRGFNVLEESISQAISLEEASRSLADILFPSPIRMDLAKAKSLSIFPVGPISTIPLSMLEPLGDGRAVVDLFPVNIISKIDDLKGVGLIWSEGFSTSLILGNPTSNDAEWEFPDLPGAAGEAQLAFERFGGTLAIGPQATVRVFQDLAPHADLIVIAAHGIADSEDPIERSFLALSDGRLTPRKIQAQKYKKSPVVVLSACQSGLGRSLDAGIMGIARSFQVMGAGNTVMSLWNVDDDATLYLMASFYRKISDWGPSEGLRLAMLDTRQKYPDPSKWAAFLTFGPPVVKWTGGHR